MTKEVYGKVLIEYLAVKHTNFNTIASFFTRYTLLRKCIKNTKFEIDNNFEITFLYNTVRSVYPINIRYWAAVLEAKELDLGTFLFKFSNISNVEFRTNIDINIQKSANNNNHTNKNNNINSVDKKKDNSKQVDYINCNKKMYII